MNGFWRLVVGMAGGLAATASKVMALDITRLSQALDQGNMAGISDLRVTIFIFAPILIFLGGLIAWATDESNRMKLLAIGCAAPALIAPWTAGDLTPKVASNGFSFASSAFAQEQGAPTEQGGFLNGVQVLLGLKTVEEERYWVIVGSHATVPDAEAFAAAINAAKPELQAFVGNKSPDSDFYPVIVGGTDAYLPYDAANMLIAEATSLSIIPEAYLSAYRDRVPTGTP